MKWKLAFSVFVISVLGGFKPMIGPVLLNATESTIEFEAHFEDGHEVKAFLEPTNFGWLSHDESPLNRLRVTSDGREIVVLNSDVLRSWHVGISRKNPLVVVVRGATAESIPYGALSQETRRLEEERRKTRSAVSPQHPPSHP